MSLLLDALKKAEEAKRQASAQEGAGSPAAAGTAAELSIEPVAAPPVQAPPTSQLPDLSAHLDTLDADLAAMPTTPPVRKGPSVQQKPPPMPQTGAGAEREAARNVFSAKRTPAPSRTTLWIVLTAVGLAALSIGGWFVWQLQSMGNNSLSARPAPSASAIQQPPPAAVPPQALTPPPQTMAPPAEPEAAAPIFAPEKTPKAAPAPHEAESPVRITRGELRINPALLKAYEQLQADDLNAAARSYEQVLRADPRNTDALLGMAAIAQRTGQTADAENWYVRALEADPKDINAQAGLINLRGQTDPTAAESRLKGLLATQPDSATLNFALGNLYAGQRRWPDAQLAYFHAHTADPANPDYLFNLAASLDNMHMPKLALEYYQSALAAGAGRKTGFDVNQVKARVLELQR